jgi:hypothetical protein
MVDVDHIRTLVVRTVRIGQVCRRFGGYKFGRAFLQRLPYNILCFEEEYLLLSYQHRCKKRRPTYPSIRKADDIVRIVCRCRILDALEFLPAGFQCLPGPFDRFSRHSSGALCSRSSERFIDQATSELNTSAAAWSHLGKLTAKRIGAVAILAACCQLAECKASC